MRAIKSALLGLALLGAATAASARTSNSFR